MSHETNPLLSHNKKEKGRLYRVVQGPRTLRVCVQQATQKPRLFLFAARRSQWEIDATAVLPIADAQKRRGSLDHPMMNDNSCFEPLFLLNCNHSEDWERFIADTLGEIIQMMKSKRKYCIQYGSPMKVKIKQETNLKLQDESNKYLYSQY